MARKQGSGNQRVEVGLALLNIIPRDSLGDQSCPHNLRFFLNRKCGSYVYNTSIEDTVRVLLNEAILPQSLLDPHVRGPVGQDTSSILVGNLSLIITRRYCYLVGWRRSSSEIWEYTEVSFSDSVVSDSYK